MNEVYDFLFAQYSGYSPLFIILEAVAILFGVISVVFSSRNSILVYPAGIVSTAIYVYLLYQWDLYGDLIINAYYFYMSFYGWLLWSRRDSRNNELLKITTMTAKDNLKSILIFLVSVIFVSGIYLFFNKFTYWWAYADTFNTGLFFIGMWLLAKRKIENWLFLMAGNIIGIPLYFFKGYTLSAILYLFLTIIAVYGYFEWKKILLSEKQQL